MGFPAAPGSDVRPETGQLKCPKCKALTVNVHVSDIIRDNGRVTCSNCGHERTVLVNVPAANRGGAENNQRKKEVIKFDEQYLRQGGRCFWHGAIVPVSLMTRDHIHPRKGGSRERGGGDYILACENCNRARSALTIGSLRFTKWLRRVLRGDVRSFTRRDAFVHNAT